MSIEKPESNIGESIFNILRLIILIYWIIPYSQITCYIIYEKLCKHRTVRIIKIQKCEKHIQLFSIFSPLVVLFILFKMIHSAYNYNKSSERDKWETDMNTNQTNGSTESPKQKTNLQHMQNNTTAQYTGNTNANIRNIIPRIYDHMPIGSTDKSKNVFSLKPHLKPQNLNHGQNLKNIVNDIVITKDEFNTIAAEHRDTADEFTISTTLNVDQKGRSQVQTQVETPVINMIKKVENEIYELANIKSVSEEQQSQNYSRYLVKSKTVPIGDFKQI